MRPYHKSIVAGLLIILITACRNAQTSKDSKDLTQALLHCAREFHATDVSYLVAEKGHITHEYGGENASTPDTALIRIVQEHFMAPLVLDRMMKDSLAGEQDSAFHWLPAKGLIYVPADYYEWDAKNYERLTERTLHKIEKYQHAVHYSISEGFPGELKLYPTAGLPGLYRNLWSITQYFDRSFPEYGFQGRFIYNVFPTWYTRSLSGFFGWKILKFQRQTIFWNCFTEGTTTILLMKSVEKEAFAAIGYRSGSIPSPTDLNRLDLLQSPLAIAMLKNLYLLNPDIDYRTPADPLLAAMKGIQSSSYNFIYLHDLSAHAELYRRMGMTSQADALSRIRASLMNDSLLERYEYKPVLAEINYVSDNFKAAVPFDLPQGAMLQIFAGGQVRPFYDYEYNPWECDNIQLFLNDHAGDKNNPLSNTLLFQFNYASDKIRYQENGQNRIRPSREGQYVSADPTDTSYIIEARIPWKTLNNVRHGAGRSVLANVLLSDADLDEHWRKSILSWAVGPGENFADEKKFGRIILAPKRGAANNKTLYAIRAPRPLRIDGVPEAAWDQAPWAPILLPFSGTVRPRDNAGRFKAMFDDRSLYLLFDITDNLKDRLGITTVDKCWIEEADSGLPVWEMKGDTTEAYPGFSDRKKLFLPAGKYVLKYVSDKGHSYEHWYGKPPANGVYGACVYLAEK